VSDVPVLFNTDLPFEMGTDSGAFVIVVVAMVAVLMTTGTQFC
jgi:hypothetical protein